MNRIFTTGGIVASVVLIVFGIASIVVGAAGRSEVRDQIEREKIVGTPDMHEDIANEPVETGDQARKFADGIREHALADTGGRTYAEMGRFLDAKGNETDDEAKAAKDPETGEPVNNQARNLWVTATSLSTALNTSYFAEQVANFSIVMGIALLITGIGFLVLTLSLRKRVPAGPAS